MNRQKFYMAVGVAALVVVLIGVGVFGFIYVNGGSGQASEPISAPVLALEKGTQSTQQQFRIDTNSSQVRFTLTEDLMGKPTTVVGKTNQIAGDILVDFSQLSTVHLGTIRINVRTLATDSSVRDRMIRSRILESSQDQYEYVTFVPKSVDGLPDKAVTDQTYTFKVTGDLTVRSVTKSVTFDVTAKFIAGSPARLEGTATTTVRRADFNLQIPNVPSVANVSEEVKLQLDFVAPQVSANNAETQPITVDL